MSHDFKDDEEKQAQEPQIAYDFEKDDYLYHLHAEMDEKEVEGYLFGY